MSKTKFNFYFMRKYNLSQSNLLLNYTYSECFHMSRMDVFRTGTSYIDVYQWEVEDPSTYILEVCLHKVRLTYLNQLMVSLIKVPRPEPSSHM